MAYNTNQDILSEGVKSAIEDLRDKQLGQVGAIFNDGQDAVSAPSGYVIVAITMVTDVTFNASGGLLASDTTKFMNTAGATTAPAGTIVDASNTFPAGMTIYGRWSQADPASGSIIAYIGD